MSCNKCGLKVVRSVDNKNSIKCSMCNKLYHANCVSSASIDLSINDKIKSWICDVCVKCSSSNVSDKISSGSINTAVTLETLFNEIVSMKDDNRSNFAKIFNQLSDFENLLSQVKILEAEITVLKAVINENQCRIENLEKMSRDNCIEITGLPTSNTDNVEDVVVKFITTGFGMSSISSNDIDYCFKKKVNNNKPSHSSVVFVKFVSRKTKENIMKKKYNDKLKLSTTVFGVDANNATPIFVNESISYAKRQLYLAAKKAKLESNYKYLWMRNSTIMMRRDTGQPIKQINSLEDLKNLSI